MWGYTYDAIGGNFTSSNNYCAMSGYSSNLLSPNYNKYYATQKYGFSNNISKIPIRDDIWNLYTANNYITYFDTSTLPILQSNLIFKVNNSNYIGPASNWEISLPNTNSTYSQFKYQYDISTQKYKVLQQIKSNSNISTTSPISTDSSSTSTIPYYLLSLLGESNISTYRSNLDLIIASSTNKIKSLEEAAIYQTLSNQKFIQKNNTFDFSEINNSIGAYKDILKPAVSNVLKELVTTNSTQLIKNLDNTIFNTIISNRNNDKLYIPSNIKLASNEVDSLFTNQTDLLLLESTLYTIDLNGPIMTIDTTYATDLNTISIYFNSNTYILDSNNYSFDIEYEPSVWKRIQIAAIGSASIQVINLDNYMVFKNDNLGNYLISTEDEFICLANEGYGYNTSNTPINYMTANYLQTSNLDFTVRSNIMIDGLFKGTYDGNNCQINNLNYYNLDSIHTSNFALFQNVDGGIIKNITLSNNLNISGSNTNITGNINYGGIVYCASNNTLIHNCQIKGSGKININGSMGLICNQTTGSNIIIKNCLTQYVGDIYTGNDCGCILGKGSGITNTYVLYSTNLNYGNEYHIGGSNGGIVGKDATVFGCLNNKVGDWNGNSNSGGIISNGIAIACINSIQGNLNSNLSNNSIGGIINNGTASYCINSMIGNIYGNENTGAISGSNGIVNYCLNIMKGSCYGYPIGGSNTSNNICMMYGKSYNLTNSINNFGITDYKYNNSISQLPLININDINTYIPTSDYFNYLSSNNEFSYPYLASSLSYNINSNIYIGSAPYWFTGYPNIEADFNIASSNLNFYGIYQDKLTKLNTKNLIYINIGLDISFGKKFIWNFSWDNDNIVNDIHVGIGTNITPKTFNIGGDLNLSGNLYDSNNNLVLFDIWSINSNNDYYYKNNIGISKSNPEYLLDVNGDIRANTFLDISDIRLKSNIQNEQLGLDFIKQLQPKTFKYKSTSNIKHGFIAQDLLNIGYNDFVDKDSNNFYSLRIIDLIAPIVNAIKEL
jgi:hypothetical protein